MIPCKKRMLACCCALALGSLGGLAHANDMTDHPAKDTALHSKAVVDGKASRTPEQATDRMDMRALVVDAADVVRQMRRSEALAQTIDRAAGVYIVPNYGRGALVVGGRGGAGVLVLQKDGKWTGPAQYDFGGVSAGLEAGAEVGALVMILNTKAAVEQFMQDHNWSLNAEAGLTVANWSGKAQATTGKDVVMWSDTEGLLGGVAISVTDINFDKDQTAAYYGEHIDRSELFSGETDDPKATVLIDALDTAS